MSEKPNSQDRVTLEFPDFELQGIIMFVVHRKEGLSMDLGEKG